MVTGGEGAGLKDGGRGTIGFLIVFTGLNNSATFFVFCLLERFLLFTTVLTVSATIGLTAMVFTLLVDAVELVLVVVALAVVEVAPLALVFAVESPKLRYLLIYFPPYLRERK